MPKIKFQDYKDYNKKMRQLGANEKTWDEYVAYISGKSKKYKPKIISNMMTPKRYIRSSPVVQSGEGIAVHLDKKQPMSYNGERKLIGIGAMHKSNLVPIFDSRDAEDLSKMRRG